MQNLTYAEFVKNFAVVYDGLIELSDLSPFLRRRDMTLTEADKIIKCTIQVLESKASSPGCHVEEATEAVENKM